MEPAIVSALAAVLGSLVGGSATLVAAWFTQENLNLPIDLGWIEQDVACDGAEEGVAGCE